WLFGDGVHFPYSPHYFWAQETARDWASDRQSFERIQACQQRVQSANRKRNLESGTRIHAANPSSHPASAGCGGQWKSHRNSSWRAGGQSHRSEERRVGKE